MDGLTVLLIPVREAETIVRRRALQVAPSLLPRDGGVAAHITLLAPFMPTAAIDDGVVSELQRFFSDVTSFDFELTGVCQFPNGTTYLSPEPANVFRRLTQGLHRLFPEFPPYGGEFDETIPHLTVPLAGEETAADLRATLDRRLPISARAGSAALVSYAEDDTRTLARFTFGTTAA